jgi:glucose/arabinose dehydrogenase
MRLLAEPLEQRQLLATVPTGFTDTAYTSPIDSGTAMAFAPDGRLFVLSQTGTVYITQPSGATSPALTIPVNSFSERGLLGVAIDPAFESNNYIYLYYTELPAGQDAASYSGGTRNRVSRFTVTGNTISPASEQLIMQLDPLIAAGNHNAGAMNFGPDGKLYIAVGDNTDGRNAQRLDNRLGKILRINADGSIPADNPTSFAGVTGTTTGANRAIWALGFRNPYSFTIAPDGRLFANEVGFNSFEEVNLVSAGKNYGWPTTEGGFDAALYPDFTNPLYYYGHGGGTQLGFAITGGVYYPSSAATGAFPAAYQGKYFFCDYGGGWINMIDPATPPSTPSSAANFATGIAGVVGLSLGPDNAIYYIQRDGAPGVRRIAPTEQVAPVISRDIEDVSVSIGENATFSVEASGPGPFTYQWQRNGVDIPGATSATLTFDAVTQSLDQSAIRVSITNAFGTALSSWATLRVTNNRPPVPTIAQPTGTSPFSAGDVIAYSGSATDPEDGALASSKLTWTIVFHHDTHTHPFLGPIDGVGSGTFTIPTVGEPAANVWYRVILTATDSAGRSASTYRDVLPKTSNFTLNTTGIPAGATLNLDAQPRPSGTVTLGVVGMERSIDAPETQVIDGLTYRFVSWSDGGARNHTIVTPAANAVFTATYALATSSTNLVSGKVADSSAAGVAGVRVYLDPNWNSRFDTGELSTTTDATGSYSLQYSDTGVMHLLPDLPAYAPQDGYWYSIAAVGDERTLNFTVPTQAPPANRVSGRVTFTTSGAPLPSTRVYLDANWNSKFDAGESSVSTNSTGDYVLNFDGTGTVHVMADASTSGTPAAAVTPADGYWYSIVAPGDQRTFNFTATAAAAVNRASGKTTYVGGAAASGVRVYLDANWNSRFDTGELSVLSNATGDYALEFPGTGTMHVMTDAANPTPADGFWYSVSTPGDQRTLNFTLPAPTPPAVQNRASGTITNSSGAAVSGAQVFLDSNWNSRYDAGESTTTSAANGSYSLDFAGTGTMHVMAVGAAVTPGDGYWYSVATVGDQRTLNFTISTVAPLNRASGRVTNASGAGAASIRVYLDVNWNSRFDAGDLVTTTSSTGDYALQFSGTGTMHVLVDGAITTPADGYWYSVASQGDQRTLNFAIAAAAATAPAPARAPSRPIARATQLVVAIREEPDQASAQRVLLE